MHLAQIGEGQVEGERVVGAASPLAELCVCVCVRARVRGCVGRGRVGGWVVG